MNLIVVDKCTNHCAYCFASTEMARNTKLSQLSREAIEEVLPFIRCSGPKFQLNIIGGEPFLYTDLDYLLGKLCYESSFGTATIFTGGIFATKRLESIATFTGKIALLVNLNERRDYKSIAEYDLVFRNMEYALELGIPLNIGMNIWRVDFNYEEIISVCREFGVEHLRWTIAYPEAKPMPGVTVLSSDTYSTVARRCAMFLEAAYKAKINAYLDCPLPKCFFTPEELGRILLTQPKSAAAIRSCGPVVDVSPDLTVFRCFAVSDCERRKLTDFENFSTLVSWFEHAIDDRYARPHIFETCERCEFAEDRSCYGGCLAHNVGSIGQRPTVEYIIQKVHEALSGNRFEEAEFVLDMLPRRDAVAALLRSHLYLRMRRKKEAISWARIAVNRSRTSGMRQKAIDMLESLKAKSEGISESRGGSGLDNPKQNSHSLPVLIS